MRINYPVNNFYQIVQKNAEKSRNKIAIFEETMKISNGELVQKIDKVAAYLCDLEIKKGDKVALVMSNSWQFVVNLFAISKIGAVTVPVNNFLKHDELVYILNDSQSKLLFASAKYSDEVRDLMIKTNVERIIWVDGLPLENEVNLSYDKLFVSYSVNRDFNASAVLDDLAVLIYTSGTTGRPKGAMLSYRNLLSIVYGAFEHFAIKAGHARLICYLPMFHAFTLAVTLLLPLAANSGVVIVRSISSKKDFKNLLKLVLVHRCRYFAGVPDIFSAMARAKLPWYFHWFHNVRGWISGAAPLSEEAIRRFSANFRGKLLQGYGLSECASGVSLNQPWANKFGSVGRALPSFTLEAFSDDAVQLRRGEIGELYVKGDCVMQGYFNRPEDSAEVLVDGWFKTGDIGYVDSAGFIYIVDRKKDLIINKGMNIYPREIEEFIYTYDKVSACAVVGLKDIEEDETPIAYIELKEGEVATERELKEFLKPLLAPFKQPRKIYFLDKLPRNATGKILKRELRNLQNN